MYKLVLMVLTLTLTISANAADTAPTDPCVGVNELTSTDVALQARYDKARLLCADRILKNIGNIDKNEKYSAIADALTQIGSISGNSGTITSPEKADHIGIWQAKKTLFDAAVEVGDQLRPEWHDGKHYLLLTEREELQQRLSVWAAMTQFDALRQQLEKMSSEASKYLTVSSIKLPQTTHPPATDLTFYSLQTTLALIPPVVGAAEAIAGIFKTSSTMSSISLTASKEVIWAGVCKGGCSGVILPGTGLTPEETKFQSSYRSMVNTAAEARKTQVNLLAAIEKKGADKASKTLVSWRDAVGAQLEEYEALIKAVHAPREGKTTTLFEELSQAAVMTYGPNNATGTLLITANAFGGNGGVLNSKWRSDRLLYQTTAALTYTLMDASGRVLKTGFVPKSDFSLRSQTDPFSESK